MRLTNFHKLYFYGKGSPYAGLQKFYIKNAKRLKPNQQLMPKLKAYMRQMVVRN